jgi:uncharacterized protein YodC (DUF2158 family)
MATKRKPKRAPKFKPGDIVRLKAGGPAMVVEVYEDGDPKCAWFDTTGNEHAIVFYEHTLEKSFVRVCEAYR